MQIEFKQKCPSCEGINIVKHHLNFTFAKIDCFSVFNNRKKTRFLYSRLPMRDIRFHPTQTNARWRAYIEFS